MYNIEQGGWWIITRFQKETGMYKLSYYRNYIEYFIVILNNWGRNQKREERGWGRFILYETFYTSGKRLKKETKKGKEK